jgi:hypothetical protein
MNIRMLIFIVIERQLRAEELLPARESESDG